MLWGCVGCRTVYRLRLLACPRCRGTEFERTDMAKITKHGGPSVAALPVEDPAAAVAVEEVSEPVVEEVGTGVPADGDELTAGGTEPVDEQPTEVAADTDAPDTDAPPAEESAPKKTTRAKAKPKA